jgi:hypothetical protein
MAKHRGKLQRLIAYCKMASAKKPEYTLRFTRGCFMAKYLDYITPSASFEEMAYVDQYFSDMISGEFFREVTLGLYETIKIPDTLHEMFQRVHEAYLAR